MTIGLLIISLQSYAGSHHPQDFLNQISGQKDEAAQIVGHFCAACHAQNPMIVVGAPRQGVVKDWDARVKNGLSLLFKHTEQGIRAMPPRGGCFECSDAQLQAAILELLPEAMRKRLTP